MLKLEDYPLAYEDMPSDTLIRKITDRTRTLKLKAVKEGWIAQIRVYSGGKREEVSAIANSPKEALSKLDKSMSDKGIYNVSPVHER